MGILDKVKAKADRNDDGEVNKDDLTNLGGDDNNDPSWVDKIKHKADHDDNVV